MTFGDTGTGFVITTPPGGAVADTDSYAVAIDSKDRIVVGGEFGVEGPGWDVNGIFTVARYLPDGTSDSSFGYNGSVQTLIVPGETQSSVQSLAIDDKDRIVAAGYTKGGSTAGAVIARYDENGGLDHSFAHSGVIAETHNGFFSESSVKIDSKGRIVALGTDFDSTSLAQISVLSRYLDDGEADGSFGNEAPGFSVSADIVANGLLIDSSDRILVAGSSSSDDMFALARFDKSGFPDDSFGSSALVDTSTFVPPYTPVNLAWDTTGGIVAGASVERSFAAFRFHADGSIDDEFGDEGVAVVPLTWTTSYFVAGVAADDNGLTLAGWANDGTDESFMLARLKN
jgi:uncharacterized delta-60 repeat protein